MQEFRFSKKIQVLRVKDLSWRKHREFKTRKVLAMANMQNQQYKFGESIDKEEAEHQKIIWLIFKGFVIFLNAFLRLSDKIRWKMFHKISSNHYGHLKMAKVRTKKRLNHCNEFMKYCKIPSGYHYMLISRKNAKLKDRNEKLIWRNNF